MFQIFQMFQMFQIKCWLAYKSVFSLLMVLISMMNHETLKKRKSLLILQPCLVIVRNRKHIIFVI